MTAQPDWGDAGAKNPVCLRSECGEARLNGWVTYAHWLDPALVPIICAAKCQATRSAFDAAAQSRFIPLVWAANALQLALIFGYLFQAFSASLQPVSACAVCVA